MEIRNFALYLLSIHVPVYILLFIILSDITSQDLYRLLAINLVYANTAFTYVALCVLPPISKMRPGRSRVAVISFKIFPFLAWACFYDQVFSRHIQGTDWLILLYVAFVTWTAWAISFSATAQVKVAVKPISELLYEFGFVVLSLLTAYGLYDRGFLTMTSWVLVALLFINISLLWLETVRYLAQIKIISANRVMVLHAVFMMLFLIPLLYTQILTAFK